MTRHALPLTLLLLSLCACGNRETAAPAPEASSSTAPPSVAETSAAPSAQPGSNAGVGPISSHGAVIDPQANSQRAAGAEGSIDFDIPKRWQSQKVSSSMRVAQAA